MPQLVENHVNFVELYSARLQKRFFDLSAEPLLPVFKKASHLPKLTLDTPKLDEKLHFLALNNKVCTNCIHAQKLIERLCVRAQLPSRYGSLDSKVLLIDGANSPICIDV